MATKTKGSVREGFRGVTPVEASWLTELSSKTINATIDRGELAREARTRGLRTSDVLYLLIRKTVGSALSAEAKRELYQRVSDLPLDDWRSLPGDIARAADVEIPLAGGMLRVEVKSACQRLAKRWEALRNATAEIVSDPAIRAGEPVIRGTRIPVYAIAALLNQGADAKELMEDYPGLSAARLRAVLAYVQTRPKRGRPRAVAWKSSRKTSGRAKEPMNATSRR